MKRASLPPEMLEMFSAYGLTDPQLVDDPSESTAPPQRVDIWISYVARTRTFSAHREGIGTLQASSLRELHTKIAEALPGVEVSLHLSKVARREVVRRKNGGGPAVPGWH